MVTKLRYDEPSEEEKTRLVADIMKILSKEKGNKDTALAIAAAILQGKKQRNVKCPKCGHEFSIDN